MIICLHKGTGIIGDLIKLQTRGHYSHASILCDNRLLFEAREFKGVVFSHIPYDEQIDYFYIPLNDEQEIKIFEFIDRTLGAKYDYKMVARFLSRLPASDDTKDKYFCSELVFDSLKFAGILLFNNTEGWQVSPHMLSMSTKLRKIEHEKIIENHDFIFGESIRRELFKLSRSTRSTPK